MAAPDDEQPPFSSNMEVAQAKPSTLTRLWENVFVDAYGTVTENVKKYLLENIGADVIIVTGAAGAGKSSVIKSITGRDIYIGSTLKSGTTTTALVPATVEGKQYLFIDMPGFNNTNFDDIEVFHLLMACITEIQPFVKFTGVLYVDPVKDNCVTSPTHKILQWLFLFCGPTYMKNVTIVTTMWDGLDVDKINDKLGSLAGWQGEKRFRQLLRHGASIYHHGLAKDGDNYRTLHIGERADERQQRLQDMIAGRYHNAPELQLQITYELDLGLSLSETTAATLLRASMAPSAVEANGITSQTSPES